MASNALSAFGTLLKVGDAASPEVFTAVAELRSLNGPGLQADTIDTTVHNGTTPWRRFISGLLDGGTVEIDINFIPTEATHGYSTGLLLDFCNRTRRNFQIVFPDVSSTTWAFSGVVTSFEISADPDDALQASISIKVSGSPTFA